MTKDLETARQDADHAKSQLVQTAGTLKSSILPAALVATVSGLIRARAATFVINSLLSARKKPRVAAGVAIATALYAFRKPLADAMRRRQSKETSDE